MNYQWDGDRHRHQNVISSGSWRMGSFWKFCANLSMENRELIILNISHASAHVTWNLLHILLYNNICIHYAKYLAGSRCGLKKQMELLLHWHHGLDQEVFKEKSLSMNCNCCSLLQKCLTTSMDITKITIRYIYSKKAYGFRKFGGYPLYLWRYLYPKSEIWLNTNMCQKEKCQYYSFLVCGNNANKEETSKEKRMSYLTHPYEDFLGKLHWFLKIPTSCSRCYFYEYFRSRSFIQYKRGNNQR